MARYLVGTYSTAEHAPAGVGLPEGEAEIADPLEAAAYDALASTLRRVRHPDAALTWTALRRDDGAVCVLIDDDSGELFYALQPWKAAEGTVWELVDCRAGDEQLRWSPSRLLLAVDAVAELLTRPGHMVCRRAAPRRAGTTH